jgi:hypothetical protein
MTFPAEGAVASPRRSRVQITPKNVAAVTSAARPARPILNMQSVSCNVSERISLPTNWDAFKNLSRFSLRGQEHRKNAVP